MNAPLPVRLVDKPWGRVGLPAPFGAMAAAHGRQIGEIWFEPAAELADLLVKYIFTSEKLSVQVHPSDAQAMARGLGRAGKEECWYVLDAEGDARLGIGFDAAITPEAMHAAALDGSIEARLVWHKVAPGDFFYIPAGTVHAIGAGVTVVEVQQTSDVTYRLYDYGRPRELHLGDGLAVALGEVYDLARWHRRLGAAGAPGAAETLVAGPHFTLARITGQPAPALLPPGPLLAIPLTGTLAAHGQTIAAGQCALVDQAGALDWAANGVCLLAGAA